MTFNLWHFNFKQDFNIEVMTHSFWSETHRTHVTLSVQGVSFWQTGNRVMTFTTIIGALTVYYVCNIYTCEEWNSILLHKMHIEWKTRRHTNYTYTYANLEKHLQLGVMEESLETPKCICEKWNLSYPYTCRRVYSNHLIRIWNIHI